jgi:AhpD family alkylhydroperoxidase
MALPGPYLEFKKRRARLWRAYDRVGVAAAESGPLDERTRELVKLGMAAAAHSESAVHSHVHRALDAGAEPAEIEHAIVLGITTIGFPRMMAALTWAHAAMATHE